MVLSFTRSAASLVSPPQPEPQALSPEAFGLLRNLNMRLPNGPRDAISRNALLQGLSLEPEDMDACLAELKAAGLIWTKRDGIGLTPEGRERCKNVADPVARDHHTVQPSGMV